MDISEGFWAPPKRKEIYNITIYNCIIKNCGCGIYPTNTTNIRIINSTIHNNSGTGLYVIDSTNIIIDNCTIYKNGQGDQGVGIGIWKSPDGIQTRGTVTIRNCRIYENLWNGISISKSGSNKGELTNITIYNNIIDNNRINEPYDKHGTGIDIRRTTNITIKNNIITNHPISQNIGGGIYLSDCKKTTIEKNNITKNGLGIKIWSYYKNIIPNYTIKNNNFIKNKIQAEFYYRFPQGLLEKTSWIENYWDNHHNKKPKKIIGYLAILSKRYAILAIIPYLDFDKKPAEKPYNIKI